MGNKLARQLTRPKEKGKEAVCDRFDLQVTYRHPLLRIELHTDLPLNTRVAIAVSRTFEEKDGHTWIWTMLDMTEPVVALRDGINGLVLERSYDHLDANGLKSWKHLVRSMSVELATLPSAETIIVLNAPSGEHRFGICNRKLTGLAVIREPSGHYVQRGASIMIPLSPAVREAVAIDGDVTAIDDAETVANPLTDENTLSVRSATLTTRRV